MSLKSQSQARRLNYRAAVAAGMGVVVAGNRPVVPAAPAASWVAAVAGPWSEGARAAEHDEALRPGRRNAAPRVAGQFTDDVEPIRGGWRRLD